MLVTQPQVEEVRPGLFGIKVFEGPQDVWELSGEERTTARLTKQIDDGTETSLPGQQESTFEDIIGSWRRAWDTCVRSAAPAPPAIMPPALPVQRLPSLSDAVSSTASAASSSLTLPPPLAVRAPPLPQQPHSRVVDLETGDKSDTDNEGSVLNCFNMWGSFSMGQTHHEPQKAAAAPAAEATAKATGKASKIDKAEAANIRTAEAQAVKAHGPAKATRAAAKAQAAQATPGPGLQQPRRLEDRVSAQVAEARGLLGNLEAANHRELAKCLAELTSLRRGAAKMDHGGLVIELASSCRAMSVAVELLKRAEQDKESKEFIAAVAAADSPEYSDWFVVPLPMKQESLQCQVKQHIAMQNFQLAWALMSSDKLSHIYPTHGEAVIAQESFCERCWYTIATPQQTQPTSPAQPKKKSGFAAAQLPKAAGVAAQLPSAEGEESAQPKKRARKGKETKGPEADRGEKVEPQGKLLERLLGCFQAVLGMESKDGVAIVFDEVRTKIQNVVSVLMAALCNITDEFSDDGNLSSALNEIDEQRTGPIYRAIQFGVDDFGRAVLDMARAASKKSNNPCKIALQCLASSKDLLQRLASMEETPASPVVDTIAIMDFAKFAEGCIILAKGITADLGALEASGRMADASATVEAKAKLQVAQHLMGKIWPMCCRNIFLCFLNIGDPDRDLQTALASLQEGICKSKHVATLDSHGYTEVSEVHEVALSWLGQCVERAVSLVEALRLAPRVEGTVSRAELCGAIVQRCSGSPTTLQQTCSLLSRFVQSWPDCKGDCDHTHFAREGHAVLAAVGIISDGDDGDVSDAADAAANAPAALAPAAADACAVPDAKAPAATATNAAAAAADACAAADAATDAHAATDGAAAAAADAAAAAVNAAAANTAAATIAASDAPQALLDKIAEQSCMVRGACGDAFDSVCKVLGLDDHDYDSADYDGSKFVFLPTSDADAAEAAKQAKAIDATMPIALASIFDPSGVKGSALAFHAYIMTARCKFLAMHVATLVAADTEETAKERSTRLQDIISATKDLLQWAETCRMTPGSAHILAKAACSIVTELFAPSHKTLLKDAGVAIASADRLTPKESEYLKLFECGDMATMQEKYMQNRDEVAGLCEAHGNALVALTLLRQTQAVAGALLLACRAAASTTATVEAAKADGEVAQVPQESADLARLAGAVETVDLSDNAMFAALQSRMSGVQRYWGSACAAALIIKITAAATANKPLTKAQKSAHYRHFKKSCLEQELTLPDAVQNLLGQVLGDVVSGSPSSKAGTDVEVEAIEAPAAEGAANPGARAAA